MITSGCRTSGLALVFFGLSLPITAQDEKLLPPSDRSPRLILAHAGPHAPVTALAFAPDASTLYVGGFDKQVRRYELKQGKYEPVGSIRVPIGPGNAGVINAIAVSPDGKWVAVAGRAPMRGEDWASTDDGIDADRRRLLPEVLRDLGVVYLFDPANPNGGKVLRGQQAAVRALAFANPSPADGPVLVTVGIELNQKKTEMLGTVRVFHVTTGAEIAARADLPGFAGVVPPGVAAWATGGKKDNLRVAVNWETADRTAGKLLVWDRPGTATAESDRPAEGAFNSPLAIRTGKDGAAVEIITGSFLLDKGTGGLTVRPAAKVNESKIIPLAVQDKHLLVPYAIAVLNVKGAEAIAVVARVRGGNLVGRQDELRLLTATGTQTSTVVLSRVPDSWSPVLRASPDGRFVAVAGFTDNRIEVYNATDLAAGKGGPQTLKGEADGFDKVLFLGGEKLWLGRGTDTLEKGGVVLDLALTARVAMPRGPKDDLKPDTPVAGGAVAEVVEGKAFVMIGGAKKEMKLLPGETATAIAYLPGKPAWDVPLGPIVAVAHVEDRTQTSQVTLLDATTGKSLYRLGGPTLPIKSLAFSGSRALLAGAGEDGTIAVWSLKNISRKWPIIEGMYVTLRGGEVVVTTVRLDSPANEKIKVDEVIESVADAKGVQQPVKTPPDFVAAVRSLTVGENAKIKIKGKAAVVEVPVGVRTGFRQPLFTLWVDPIAKDGRHDWVGWTASGPYDANADAAEARIGWLTSTGDPARPVSFAGANQYRKLFYKRDFLRLLLNTADYNDAVALLPPLRPATLLAQFDAPRLRDGRLVTREKIDRLGVALDDPDSALDRDRVAIQWRILGPAGASEWKLEPFGAGRMNLDLSNHVWKRGEHRVQIRLLPKVDDASVYEATADVWYVPPPPVLGVAVGGKPHVPGAELTIENDEIEITATVDAKGTPEGAGVTLSGLGGASVQVVRNANGTFAPTRVKIKEGTTGILVTATNQGAGVTPDIESHAIEVRVRRLLPKVLPPKVLPPKVRLSLRTEHDQRTNADHPFVVSAPSVTLQATVPDVNAIEVFEWKIGEGDWKRGTLDEKTKTGSVDVPLPVGGGPLVVQVRAKSKESAFATDTLTVRYDGLPEVTVSAPPAVVTMPEVSVTGGLKVVGKRTFSVRLLVTSTRTGQKREFEAVLDASLTKWVAELTLFPGENQIGYAIKYDGDRKEQRSTSFVAVQYIRPPLVVGAAPVEIGTGAVGNVAVAVVSARDAAHTELSVNGARVVFRTHAKPVVLFGAGLWVLRAEAVPVNPGADRLKPVRLLVRNAEVESQPAQLAVNGQEQAKVAAPTIRLTHKDKPLAPDQGLPPVGNQNFTFDVEVLSETEAARIEVWHGAGANNSLERVGGVKLGAAVAVPGGFKQSVRSTLLLRPGATNYVRVIASNEGGAVEVSFNVSYAPPPVRVIIDKITEPSKPPIILKSNDAKLDPVANAVIDVEGHILWDFDDEPIGRDRDLTVVFVVNGVAHLPVPVAPATDGRKRKFFGRVYLNALDPNPNPNARATARVRAEVRSGNRPAAIPQEGLEQASINVTCLAPLRRQRLHVLMVGVGVEDSERKALAQRVVTSMGGKIPANRPDFFEGSFERKDFESALLYFPRLKDANERDLNMLLEAARLEIEKRAKRPNEEFVNDVIVIYYQGKDWIDEKTGRWLLHSEMTLSGAAGKNPSRFAIRLDDLPQSPGMPVAVVNSNSAAKLGDTLSINLPYLRFASANGQFLPYFAKAVEVERTFGGIAEHVKKGVKEVATHATSLPKEGIGSRVVGLP